jgi:hypothetical protein
MQRDLELLPRREMLLHMLLFGQGQTRIGLEERRPQVRGIDRAEELEAANVIVDSVAWKSEERARRERDLVLMQPGGDLDDLLVADRLVQ